MWLRCLSRLRLSYYRFTLLALHDFGHIEQTCGQLEAFHVTQHILLARTCIEQRAFQVEALHLLVPKDEGPNLLWIILLDTEHVRLEMHGLFESGDIVIPVVEDDKYSILAEELAKILSLLVVIDTLHVGIPPYRTSSER